MGTYSDLLKSKPPISQDNASRTESPTSSGKPLNEQENEPQVQVSERFSERKNERLETSDSSLPFKRRTKRYSFEFYDDQILTIKRLVYEANISGENISQSDIVRAALDEYLKEEKKN